jgi:hypothetical protein
MVGGNEMAPAPQLRGDEKSKPFFSNFENEYVWKSAGILFSACHSSIKTLDIGKT